MKHSWIISTQHPDFCPACGQFRHIDNNMEECPDDADYIEAMTKLSTWLQPSCFMDMDEIEEVELEN